jgi:DNA-binding transcriptional ArsR family regulator
VAARQRRTEGARPVEEIAGLDRLVHEPARLAILTALSACDAADFPFLARISGLSHGNLSGHLSKLEVGGLVLVKKSFRGRIPMTTASITQTGRAAVDAHWERLGQLRDESIRFLAGRAPEASN